MNIVLSWIYGFRIEATPRYGFKRIPDYLTNQITDKCGFANINLKNSLLCIDGIRLEISRHGNYLNILCK
jgi:hypothetical protein